MNPMVLGQKDLPHRLQAWVAENQAFIFLLLVGGIGFFGILAGFTAWRENREAKASLLLFQTKDQVQPLEQVIHNYSGTKAEILARVTLAKASEQAKDWRTCVTRFEELYPKTRVPFFRILSLHGIALCQRGMEAFEESAKTFERASREPGHADPLASRLEALRSHRMAKNPEAEAMLQALLKEQALSPDLKTQVEAELKWFQEEKKP